MRSLSLRRVFTWCVAAVPVLMFGAVIAFHRVPEEVRASSVDLTGEFKRSATDDLAFSKAEVDDSGWDTIRLPQFTPGATSSVWARRHFALPAELEGRPLFFLGGGFWPGTEVYLNGHHVGTQDTYTRGLKPEVFGPQGWEVPAGVVRAGDNVLALRMTSVVMWDTRLLLGTLEPARSYYLDNSDLKRLILHGQLILLAFFTVLVAVFWVQEEDREEKGRYGITLHMLIAAVIYTAINVGIGRMKELTPLNSVLIWLSILYFTGCLFEWMEVYVLHRKSRARLVFRALYGAYAAVLVGLLVAKQPALLYQVWPPISASLLIPLVWGTVNAVRGAVAQWQGLGPVLLCGMALFLVSTVVDIVTPLGLLNFPRISPIGTANVGILAAVLIVGDFLRISYENKDLTASLSQSNAELAVALAQANESVRLKGEFVANVSHELRTPLNAIVNIPEGLIEAFGKQRVAACSSCSSTFELSESEKVDASTKCPECHKAGTMSASQRWTLQRDADEMISHLDLLNRSGRSLLQLVDNVLDFSRLDAGKMTLAVDEVQVERALGEAMDGLRPLAQQRFIELQVETVDAAWRLRSDPVKLTQILVNLVGNAIKFSPEKTTVSVGASFEPSGSFLFWVKDQGIGVPREAQALIFESFRQADGSHTRRHGGTGLGLSITRQLVELHEGQIWVESAGANQGSTFFFRLPRAGPRGRRSNPMLAAAGGATQTHTILVVDDDPVSIEATRIALRPLGYRVVGLSDPRRFSEWLTQERPDLIIMDAVMARVSGIILLQKLRASESGKSIPVIAASDFADQKDAFVAHQAVWLSKPWTAEQLREEVQTQLALAATLRLRRTPIPQPRESQSA